MAENATASAEPTMPAFVRAGMDFFTGKTVLKSTFDEVAGKLQAAESRIAELEKIDAGALTARITALEGSIAVKDADIDRLSGEVSRLESEYKTAARQAQEHIARAGATAPVVTEAPQNQAEKDEATQFIEQVSALSAKGMNKGAAISQVSRQNPQLHTAFIKSGKTLS